MGSYLHNRSKVGLVSCSKALAKLRFKITVNGQTALLALESAQ